MKKRFIQMMFLLLISLPLVACGSNNASEQSDGNTSGSDEQSQDSAETLSLRLAGQSPKDHPSTQALYDFAEKVNEQTNGRIEIDVFPANQLGDYTTVYEEIGRGTIDMGLISIPSTLDEKLNINFMPYLVETYSQLEDRIGKESYLFEKAEELSLEHGVQLLGFHANGFGGVGTSEEVTNITELGEDKGILLRTAPSDIFKLPMEDIGFRTVTIPFADLYTALQTGSADGWAGGEASLNYFGYRDVIDYYYTTNDFLNADGLLINEDIYNGLSDEDRSIIDKLSNELMVNSFETAEQYDNEYLDLMEKEGIEVIRLSEEEISKLASHVREVTWPKLEEHMGEEIINELQNSLQ